MGDTIIKVGASPPPSPLAIIEPSKSMLFASVYPLGETTSLGRFDSRALRECNQLPWRFI